MLGLVGESGSGKSMTARSIMRLLPSTAAASGEVRFADADVLGLDQDALRRYRSSDVAMVFQDPRAHINPVRRVGDFLTEALVRTRDIPRAEALARAERVLEEVGIDDPARRLRQYPHELSGGMLQRVMIAAALLIEPRLVLADEPTTALDVTTQSEVMAILDELRRERGVAMLFITHDLELAAAVCDRIGVMYAGQIVELRPARELHDDPLHPYAAALSASRPSLLTRVARMAQIPGRPLSAFEAPAGCAFQTRCPHVEERCRARRPDLAAVEGGLVRCVRADELRGRLATAPDAPSPPAGTSLANGSGS